MPPELDHIATGSPRWGTGVEQFMFYSTPNEVKQWYQNTNLPKIITAENLAEAPDGALAIFRSAIRFPLTEGMSVGEIERLSDKNPTVNELMRKLRPTQVQIGNIYTQPWDNDRTKNLVLPLNTESGTIEVVVNPAWGVNWRLEENHPVSRQYPQLAIVQNPDVSEPPIEASLRGPKYLPIEVLAQVGAERINPEQLTEEIGEFLTQLLEQEDLSIRGGGLMTPNIELTEDHDFSQIVFESIKNKVQFHLCLGRKYGNKRVYTFGSRREDTKLTALAEQARGLRDKIGSYTNLPHSI